MGSITYKINGCEYETSEGTTILEAARKEGIRIPSLCYLKDYTQGSACRMCLVEVKGAKNPVTACNTKISAGMEIETETESVHRLRKQNLELIASNHRMDCTYCSRFPYCELNTLMREYGLDDRTYRYSRPEEFDTSAAHLVRDNSKCILCGRCVAACEKQGIQALGLTGRGSKTRVTPGAANLALPETGCIGCGQCTYVCPVGALKDKDDTQPVFNELHHKQKHVFVGVTEEAAALLGECMREEIGTSSVGKTAAVLKKLGFEKVYSLAPFVQRAKASELAELEQRQAEKKNLPMISVRCPSAEIYIKKHYPQFENLLSKSGNAVRSFAEYCRTKAADSMGLRPEEIYLVVISTCTADKSMKYEDVDACLTVRELSAMIRRACVSDFTAMQVWSQLEDAAFDELPENFAEAAEEKVEIQEKQEAEAISIPALKTVLESVRTETCEGADASGMYIFCEACEGGCLNGGGAPKLFAEELDCGEYIEKRRGMTK